MKKKPKEEKEFLRGKAEKRGIENILGSKGEKPSLGVYFLRKKKVISCI